MTTDEELNVLDSQLRRLKIEYEIFFSNPTKRPPTDIEWKVLALLRKFSDGGRMLYTDEGDTAHALKVLSSIPDSARSAKLYSALGAAYEQRKEYKSAIDAYKHAIVLDRDNLDAIRGLAENYLNDGQLEASLEQYKVISDSNPEDAQTYVRIAEIYRRQGKYDLALENLKRADSLVPDTMDVPYSMG